MKDLVIDDFEEGSGVHIMRFANLFDGLFSHSEFKSEAADNLNGIFFMRHQIAYFIRGFIHCMRLFEVV